MRNIFYLAITLIISASLVSAQSDCGNCWSVGYGCNSVTRDSQCYIPGSGCQECAWYYVCDDMTCNYSTGTQCWCPASLNQPPKYPAKALIATIRGWRVNKYDPINFQSSLKAPIKIDRRIFEVHIKSRFWWKHDIRS